MPQMCERNWGIKSKNERSKRTDIELPHHDLHPSENIALVDLQSDSPLSKAVVSNVSNLVAVNMNHNVGHLRLESQACSSLRDQRVLY